MPCHAIPLDPESESLLWKVGVWCVGGPRNIGRFDMVVVRRHVHTAVVALGRDRHELGAHSTRLALGTHIGQGRAVTAANTGDAGARHRAISVLGWSLRHVVTNRELHPTVNHGRDDVCLLALLLAQPP